MIGLVALVLIGAVKHFAFAVDEAIEGTGFALDHLSPREFGLDGTTLKPIPGIEVGYQKKPDGTPDKTKPVFKVPIRDGGSWKWEYRTSARVSISGESSTGTGSLVPVGDIVFGKGAADRI